MARVVAFVPDLLFGSKVVSAIQAAGHEPQLIARLEPGGLADADALIVDLTDQASERAELVESIAPADVPRLAFYSHVEVGVRTLAERAGFDLVVARSRMARDGEALVRRLLDGVA